MRKRRLIVLAGGLLVLLVLLAIPAPYPSVETKADATPFAWKKDRFWEALEARFVRARARSSSDLEPAVEGGLVELKGLIQRLEASPRGPEDRLWPAAEAAMLKVAPLVAADSRKLSPFVESVHALRRVAKRLAVAWSAQEAASRRRLYRLLYGGRAAIEEVLLQAPAGGVPPLQILEAVPSAAPSITIQGITVHSGDILVSRGGAPTSALIARGSDFPGNFSHVALAHVDAKSGEGTVIESLIEKGVVLTSAADYLKDKKLRIMVLRLRADSPLLKQDPLRAHKAATYMLQRARSEHIPYDFAMDFAHHDKLFCSEVVYAAYQQVGIKLWKGLSRISAPGTARWLAGFGVSHLITLEPSDLEYDPQLVAVAEWRDADALFKDHLDNAVTDAMLEGANAGEELRYAWYLLPMARLVKAYSAIKNLWGGRGPIPEGMGAAAGLRSEWYSARHDLLAGRVKAAAARFTSRKGYRPPYWELVKMARAARREAPAR